MGYLGKSRIELLPFETFSPLTAILYEFIDAIKSTKFWRSWRQHWKKFVTQRHQKWKFWRWSQTKESTIREVHSVARISQQSLLSGNPPPKYNHQHPRYLTPTTSHSLWWRDFKIKIRFHAEPLSSPTRPLPKTRCRRDKNGTREIGNGHRSKV